MTGLTSPPAASASQSTGEVFTAHSAFAFRVTGTCASAVSGLTADFAFFRVTQGTLPHEPFQLELDLAEPDYAGLPPVDASVYTPRNVVYHIDGKRVLDFGGRGLAVLDEAHGTFRVRSLDEHLVYEAAYLFLLARIGEACDRRGLNRLHALAMSFDRKAVLVVLPMGGGKSTLGAALLDQGVLGILSDDSPFIDQQGRAHAFPLRLGLLQVQAGQVPPQHVRVIHRMEFGPKYVVDLAHYAGRIEPLADPGLLLIGRRTLGSTPRIEAASYAQVMRALLPAMILGVGLFQGLEYMLRAGVWELAGQLGTVLRRARTAHRLARRSSCHFLHLGRDSEANAAAILALAQERLSGPA